MTRRIAILAAALVCALPATAYASLGKTTTGTGPDQPGDGSTGSGQDWRAVASISETVNRLSVYLTSVPTGAGKPELGLYDSARAKKGSCTIIAPVVGWNRCAIPNVSVTSGATYWLAVLRPQGQGVVNFSNAMGTGSSFASSSSSLSVLPATWVNGTNYGAQTASLYADSATPPPPPPPAACADGIDNDGDGATDYPADPGCSSATDTDETNAPPPPPAACADGADNDGDGLIDYPADPGCSSSADTDESNVSGEPGPITGQGYHQVFRDDFTTLNRAVWDDHIWYDDPPSAAWTDFQTAENGILHLRTRPNFLYPGCSSQCWPINTVTTHSANLAFKYGYFEARMNWTGGKGSWPAFWLISEGWADTGSCSTPAGEIDVMEGQGEEPNVLYGTVHKDSAGACSGHDQNGNNWQPQSFRLADNWHTYAAKWTPTTVTWYLDGVQTHSASTYADDNQPMHVLLQMWNGGWHDDADSTSPNPLETQVDYVTIWQQ